MSQGTPRPSRRLRFHLPYLIVAIVTAVGIFFFSQQFFPQWRESLPQTAALIGLALYAALEAVANLRNVVAVDDTPPPPPPVPTIQTNGGPAQVVNNPSGRVIQAEHYFENATIQLPPIPEEAARPGSVPTSRTTRYIVRGIEPKVRDRLRARGAAAIVGVHAPGGTGKSELAIRMTGDLKPEFGEPLWIDVGEKTKEQIVADLAARCGVKFDAATPYARRVEAVKGSLVAAPRLVVLDDVRLINAPHLPDFIAPSPCATLITSRIQALGGLPAGNVFELDRMTGAQARELLEAELDAERVSAEPAAVNELMQRCHFNPLALDIAAQRIRLLKGIEQPIALFVSKLKLRLDELRVEGGGERLDLFAVFDLSYVGLRAEDQRRFRWLAAFAPSGFSPEAAARAWGDSVEVAGRALALLLNVSLLKAVPGKVERYQLHDLLDEYGAHKLREGGDYADAHRAHTRWLVQLFDDHYTDDVDTAPQVAIEFDNLLWSAQWALKEARDGTALALLATRPRNWFYNYFRNFDDWLNWLTSALSFGIEDKQLKANVLSAIGDVQQFRDDRDAALKSYADALTLFRAVGDKLGEANVLLSLGGVMKGSANLSGARETYSAALRLYAQIGDGYSVARALYRLGDCDMQEKEWAAALERFREAARLWQRIHADGLVQEILAPRIAEAEKQLRGGTP
jgi:tetratricopeptide (TPR) repeat protein